MNPVKVFSKPIKGHRFSLEGMNDTLSICDRTANTVVAEAKTSIVGKYPNVLCLNPMRQWARDNHVTLIN